MVLPRAFPYGRLPGRPLTLHRLRLRAARRLRGGPVQAVHLALTGLPDVGAGAGLLAAERLRAAVADRVRSVAGSGALVGVVGDAVVVLAPVLPVDGLLAAARGVAGAGVAAGSARRDGVTGPPDVDAVLDAAALASATAARTGARLVVADRRHRTDEDARARTELLLRRAVPEGLLRLHAQPLVDLVTGEVVGAEALVRLQQDDGTLLPPSALIPVAERTGLVVDLGTWVLRAACRQLAAWQTSAPGVHSVAVNVSATQLARPDFADVVLAALEDADVAPRRLVLELTESVLLDTGPLAVGHLLRLRAHGVRSGVDDFGTGYACLTSLRRLPVSFVKIDRSFVAGLPGGDDDAVVRAVLRLAGDLGLDCVAEGIETAGQLAALQGLGAVTGQGHLLSPPLPPEEFARVAGRLLLPEQGGDRAGGPVVDLPSAERAATGGASGELGSGELGTRELGSRELSGVELPRARVPSV